MPREMVSIRSIKMKKMNQSVANAITAVLNFTEIKVEELKNMPSSLLRDDFCHEVAEGVRLLGQSIEEGCKDADRSLRSFVSMTKKSEFTSILKISKWQRKNMENALEECELLMNLLEVEPNASLKNIDRLRTTVSNTKEDLQSFCQSRRNMVAELISRTRKVIDEQKKRENYFKTKELSNIEIENKEIEKEDPMVSPHDEPPSKKKKVQFEIPHGHSTQSTSANPASEDPRYPEDIDTELPNIGGLSTRSPTKHRIVVASRNIGDTAEPLKKLQRDYADQQRFLELFTEMEADIFGKCTNHFVECANGADFERKFNTYGSALPYLVKNADDKCDIKVQIDGEPINLDCNQLELLSTSTTRNTNEMRSFFKKTEAKRKVIDTSMINRLTVDDMKLVRDRGLGAHIKAHDLDFGLTEKYRRGFGDATEKNDLLDSVQSLVLARPSSMSSLQFEPNGSAFYYYVCTGKEVMYVKPATMEDVDLYEKLAGNEKDQWIVTEFGDFSRIEISAGQMAVLPTGCLWFFFAREKTIAIKGNFDTIENFPLAWRIAKMSSKNSEKTGRYWILLFNYVEKFFYDGYEGQEYSPALGFMLFEELSRHLGEQSSFKSFRKRKVLNSLGNRLRRDGYPDVPILKAPKRGNTSKVESANGRDMNGADDFMDED
ncbi:hypothetical protein L5515_017229 [Caenorhabditis briggsae]|uniref:JmjC domain-containing protein n=1 Tax=Caenorhabditis briggsae TaxID=6238 RepID=A0AAE9JQK7_CAEBR|nr:hypothetical protein L5515_017229 [Caenorhabditis briggsae]